MLEVQRWWTVQQSIEKKKLRLFHTWILNWRFRDRQFQRAIIANLVQIMRHYVGKYWPFLYQRFLNCRFFWGSRFSPVARFSPLRSLKGKKRSANQSCFFLRWEFAICESLSERALTPYRYLCSSVTFFHHFLLHCHSWVVMWLLC